MSDFFKQRKNLTSNTAEKLDEAILEEVEDQSSMGGFNTWNLTPTSTVGIAASVGLGNKGKVCTYTVECVNNCS
ncbi:plantaricin C family lantibiotic [Staphylococcus succinus]|uniref:plantaricin C family lantibiotic n=1 Tax=Staphylococcus succinus TaxID=61015 RepID=UPI000E6A1AF1|nr:plantaricin C family lantibiotic [Staphylococcus succinus]RIN36939.1 plantaricin C family lantibiotic [Staphylococcus succinus]